MNKNIKTILWVSGGVIIPPIAGKLISLYWHFQMWIGEFLYNVAEWDNGSIEMYGAVMTAVSLLVVLLLLVEHGSHNCCDICSAGIKPGEGKHFPNKGKDGGCYCICSTCLPTVDLEKLN